MTLDLRILFLNGFSTNLVRGKFTKGNQTQFKI